MKKLKIVVFLTFVLCNFNSFGNFNCQVNTPQREYLNHLRTIERFINLNGEKGNQNGNKLIEARLFLERITKIDSDFIPGVEITYIPSRKNYKKWRRWFQKNKELLYFNDEEDLVKFK